MDDYEMFEESHSLEETHGVQILSQAPHALRGKAFSLAENEVVCKCWLVVSEDPISGNKQCSKIFWERVLVYFNLQVSIQSNRNHVSLNHRWTLIQKGVNKFCGFLEQIQLRQRSGTTEADKIADAKHMYYTIQKKHFTFESCWEILRYSAKWIEFRVQLNKPTENAPSNSTHPTANLDKQPISEITHRPIGTKASKEKMKNKALHDVRFDEMATNQSEIVEVLKGMSSRSVERDEQKAIERQQKAVDRQKGAENREAQLQMLSMINEREQRNEEHKIMSMDMNNLNSVQKSYYEDLQRKILLKKY